VPSAAAFAAAALTGLAVVAGAEVGLAALGLAAPVAFGAVLIALRVRAREEALRRLARSDPLTGLGNARHLQERLGYEVERHRRHRRRFALLVLDLDGFKLVNDRFGHVAGDEVLRDVARALSRTVRAQDTVVRQGGDEFCVLAPETTREEAMMLGVRLRDAVAGSVGGLRGLSVTVGHAVFPEDGTTAHDLLEHADDAEVAAKRLTRRAA
jgi:diguanylate cyclase